jgi:hypothetical protein
MVDARPRYARGYGERGRSQMFKFFADDAMQPNVVDPVAFRISAALPESDRGRRLWHDRSVPRPARASAVAYIEVAIGADALRAAQTPRAQSVP